MELKRYKPAITQSMVKDYKSCKRKFLLRHIWGLAPKGVQSLGAANIGTLIHMLMEKGKGNSEEVRKFVDEEVKEYEEIISSGSDLLGDAEHNAKVIVKNFDIAKCVTELFWERNPDNPALKTIAEELACKFDVMLPTTRSVVTIAGAIDRLQSYKMQDSSVAIIRDYKSSGRDAKYTLMGYEWGIQNGMYKLLATEYLKTTNVDLELYGFILDFIQVPGITMSSADRPYELYEHTFKSGKNKGQTVMRKKYLSDEPSFELYKERVKQWFEEKDKLASTSMFMPYTSKGVHPSIEHTLTQISESIHSEPVDLLSAYPKDITGQACCLYQRACPFYDLCQNDKMLDTNIQLHYEVKPPRYDDVKVGECKLESERTKNDN